MDAICNLDEFQQKMLQALKKIWTAQKNQECGYEDLESLLSIFFDEENWADSIQKLENELLNDLEKIILSDLGVLAKLCKQESIFAWLNLQDEAPLVSQN